MLGIEPARRHDFKRWSDAAIAWSTLLQAPKEAVDRVERDLKELRHYIEGMIEARRKEPGEDLISALVQGGEGEEVLTTEEAVAFCRLLLVAGNETTTNLLGNGLIALLRNPDQLERLSREPSLIPNAIEEMLRYESPAQAVFRITTQEVQLAGKTLPAGSPLMALLGSANRDPRRFPEPERFDITREVQGQVAFGYGIHFCLGAPLARLEARVVLEELLSPERRLSFAPGQREAIQWMPNFFLRGPRSLRMRAEPRTATARTATTV
jgi:cytochrome P450